MAAYVYSTSPIFKHYKNAITTSIKLFNKTSPKSVFIWLGIKAISVTLIVKKESNLQKSIKLIMAWDQPKMEKDLLRFLITSLAKWFPNSVEMQTNKACNSSLNSLSLKERTVNVDLLTFEVKIILKDIKTFFILIDVSIIGSNKPLIFFVWIQILHYFRHYKRQGRNDKFGTFSFNFKKQQWQFDKWKY